MNIVLDTSVTLAWYLPEAFSGEALNWQEDILQDRVTAFVPSLHYLEFANVLRTHVKRGELDASTAQALYAIHLKAPLTVADPPPEKVLAVALDHNTSVYDATFITLALIRRCTLVTAERATTPWLARMGKLGVSISRPR